MTFQTGKSGNPAGRPKGSGDRYKLFQDHVGPHAPALLEKAVTMALNGNKTMLVLLLDRLLPARPKEDCIEITLKPESSLVEQTHTILKALNNGQISPGQTRSLMQAVCTEATIFEAEKLKQDVDALKAIAFPS